MRFIYDNLPYRKGQAFTLKGHNYVSCGETYKFCFMAERVCCDDKSLRGNARFIWIAPKDFLNIRLPNGSSPVKRKRIKGENQFVFVDNKGGGNELHKSN